MLTTVDATPEPTCHLVKIALLQQSTAHNCNGKRNQKASNEPADKARDPGEGWKRRVDPPRARRHGVPTVRDIRLTHQQFVGETEIHKGLWRAGKSRPAGAAIESTPERERPISPAAKGQPNSEPVVGDPGSQL